jgi:tetrahydromethanopterin S-methyltransferase subunit H
LYDKTKETLFGHTLQANLSFKQKWGSISVGSEYHNYFHNWKYFNLEANAEIDIRITGGLSFNMYTSAALIRDQIYLPKEKASQEDVLTRRRQVASDYSFYTSFGINYRFGSKLNNFVNPRFD